MILVILSPLLIILRIADNIFVLFCLYFAAGYPSLPISFSYVIVLFSFISQITGLNVTLHIIVTPYWPNVTPYWFPIISPSYQALLLAQWDRKVLFFISCTSGPIIIVQLVATTTINLSSYYHPTTIIIILLQSLSSYYNHYLTTNITLLQYIILMQ